MEGITAFGVCVDQCERQNRQDYLRKVSSCNETYQSRIEGCSLLSDPRGTIESLHLRANCRAAELTTLNTCLRTAEKQYLAADSMCRDECRKKLNTKFEN
jgi:hypothetical protein